MRKTTLLILFILPLLCYSQTQWGWEIIDTTKIVCQYKYTYPGLIQSRVRYDDMILEIGGKGSKFYSYISFEYDSLRTTESGKAIISKKAEELLAQTSGKSEEEQFDILENIPSRRTTCIIYKNYGKRDVYIQDRIGYDYCEYNDANVSQQWEIFPDTTTILNYHCQLAKCKWRGRDYEAWFTTEIPISDGPMKFLGLPGLIVNIKDVEELYELSLIGITNKSKPIYLNSNSNGSYKSIVREEYYEPGHIKLPNIAVRMNESAVEGSDSYGLIGGEQFINVPTALQYESDEEIRRFFLHAFCNAAGMFNEQQRKDRDDYVTINLNNVKSNCKSAFTKITQNYTMQGSFDYFSITLAASTDYSNGSGNTIMKTGNYSIAKTYSLSYNDIYFLNGRYLPYIARTDNYIELDDTYYPNGQKLTEAERLQLQTQLNNRLYGEPPLSGRTILVDW